MKSKTAFSLYIPRPIRFVDIYEIENWTIKIYSISVYHEFVSSEHISEAINVLRPCLRRSADYGLATYQIATLIIHEYAGGCFVVINWWTDENMLQNVVYLKRNDQSEFTLFSENGVCTCGWEMTIWWHERNACVDHVLMKNQQPDFRAYLEEHFNADV